MSQFQQPEQAKQQLLAGNYEQAIQLYEALIAADPQAIALYLELGLAYLLLGEEEAAQTTWMLTPVSEAREIAAQTDFAQTLEAIASTLEQQQNYALACAVRHYSQQFFPADFRNYLKLCRLCSLNLSWCEFAAPEALLGLAASTDSPLTAAERKLLLEVIATLAEQDPEHPLLGQLIQLGAIHTADWTQDQPLPGGIAAVANSSTLYLEDLIALALSLNGQKSNSAAALKILEACLSLDPENKTAIYQAILINSNTRQFQKALELCQLYHRLGDRLSDQTHACLLKLGALVGAGDFTLETLKTFETYRHLLQQLTAQSGSTVEPLQLSLKMLPFNLPILLGYFQDDLAENRQLHNQVAAMACETLKQHGFKHPAHAPGEFCSAPPQPLKIGFVSHCLRQHPVGWLARWFFQQYCREKFQIYLYFHSCPPDDFSHRWFISQAHQSYIAAATSKLAEKIAEDQIQILIDLDSITSNVTCELLALKPAPVQVTWLGWDASGIPGVDYYLADPYVLPANAEAHYREKIWRLPQTYIAVDGFELDAPTLHRDLLGIPADAIVYYSAQRGYKRHPETIHWQMQILKAVPQSYFLIKGLADAAKTQALFQDIAAAVGVEPERLKFLPMDGSEATHRANLSIADVILDTYPYNGATTTLEALWVGIPLVTRVGEQWAARNSYAFLRNAGVTAGIAHSGEEYVEWGIKLGTDAVLRQQVVYQLKMSRRTSPLWNTRQFTHEMEKALGQMWQAYLEQQG